MAIRLVSAPGILMKGLQDQFIEKLKEPRFIRSFFRPKATAAVTVSVETTRQAAVIAKDRERNSGSQLNRADKSTLKQFATPNFSESFNITDLDSYDRLAGSSDTISESEMDNLIDEATVETMKLQKKIERAYEKQCSDALFYRKLTFDTMEDIDFLPKAGSTINASTNGGVWSVDSNDIIESIIAGCKFSTTVGNATTNRFICLVDGKGIEQIINNQKIQSRSDIKNYELANIQFPSYMTETGAAYHGRLSAGAYQVELWSYDQEYKLDGTSTPYLPEDLAVIFPTNADFAFRYAGVSSLDPSTNWFLPKKGEWHVKQLNDQESQVTNFVVASSGLAIPYAVDQIAVIKREV